MRGSVRRVFFSSLICVFEDSSSCLFIDSNLLSNGREFFQHCWLLPFQFVLDCRIHVRYKAPKRNVTAELRILKKWLYYGDKNREKRKKRWQTKLRLRQRCQLRMINSVKSRLFILESPWQLSISWNRENNNLLLSILRTAANNKLKRISFTQGL